MGDALEVLDCELIDVLEYLDMVRESGVTNMMAAGRYIEDQFDVDRKLASRVLGFWIKTFASRKVEV